ncbi:hypothetical protein HMPREF0454_04745 [Hafnia alvei ATCC 51873]|uniref:Uncharacterized protein n=1 Tax=Hafnia alvei ATCC 51873 TaxID=1002364 RepID=G9YDP6_HAFAL|nr:hypothetical protein HMPREF0454_04745 [Hafnia alvei ATCC 51873]
MTAPKITCNNKAAPTVLKLIFFRLLENTKAIKRRIQIPSKLRNKSINPSFQYIRLYLKGDGSKQMPVHLSGRRFYLVVNIRIKLKE